MAMRLVARPLRPERTGRRSKVSDVGHERRGRHGEYAPDQLDRVRSMVGVGVAAWAEVFLATAGDGDTAVDLTDTRWVVHTAR